MMNIKKKLELGIADFKWSKLKMQYNMHETIEKKISQRVKYGK